MSKPTTSATSQATEEVVAPSDILIQFANFSLGLHRNGHLVVDRLIFPPDHIRMIADECDPNNEWGETLTNALRDIEGKFAELDEILGKGYGLEAFYLKKDKTNATQDTF